MLVGGRLSFDALQRRMVTAPSKARALVKAVPAALVAFDLLGIGGVLRTQRWTVRRGRLEQLADRWTPPLQMSLVTDDLAEAQEWFRGAARGDGDEGRELPLRPRSAGVAKKSNIANTRDIIIGGVIGPIDRPKVLFAGLYRDGDLAVVGRTAPLTPAQSVGPTRGPRPRR